MKWPLKNLLSNIPGINSPGDFAFSRKYYHHEGIDLYCSLHQEVIAIESGTIVKVDKFTGEHAHPPTPHWNNTFSILIEGASGVIGYCELEPFVKEGDQVSEGQLLGRIIPVLKKDKGNGTTMLHLELYAPGTTEHATWLLKRATTDPATLPSIPSRTLPEGQPEGLTGSSAMCNNECSVSKSPRKPTHWLQCSCNEADTAK